MSDNDEWLNRLKAWRDSHKAKLHELIGWKKDDVQITGFLDEQPVSTIDKLILTEHLAVENYQKSIGSYLRAKAETGGPPDLTP